MIRSYWCDREGKRLSCETGIEEVGFGVFPERCDRGTVTISYLERERVPKNWGIVTYRYTGDIQVNRDIQLNR